MVRDLGSMYEILDSILCSDVNKKKNKKKGLLTPWFGA
jgi:hypothetical protein